MKGITLSASAVCLAFATTACSGQPPQTGFYCLDIPADGSKNVAKFVSDLATDLSFDVEEMHSDNGEQGITGISGTDHQYLLHGSGVSMLVSSALVSGEADEYENRPTRYDPVRYSIHAFKSGLVQRVEFSKLVDAAMSAAKSNDLVLQPAPGGEGCAR